VLAKRLSPLIVETAGLASTVFLFFKKGINKDTDDLGR
jgi:hypothetical protein